MIVLTICIAYIILLKWQVVHLHWQDCSHYRIGEVIMYRHYPSTIVFMTSTDMLIRRHLAGLVKRAIS